MAKGRTNAPDGAHAARLFETPDLWFMFSDSFMQHLLLVLNSSLLITEKPKLWNRRKISHVFNGEGSDDFWKSWKFNLSNEDEIVNEINERNNSVILLFRTFPETSKTDFSLQKAFFTRGSFVFKLDYNQDKYV